MTHFVENVGVKRSQNFSKSSSYFSLRGESLKLTVSPIWHRSPISAIVQLMDSFNQKICVEYK
jgi:hypothetical protein